MKTDIQLQRDVLDELAWEPSIKEAEIAVAAKDGVVTLEGYVDTFAQKFAAERAVERVSGVRAIADDLKIKLPSILERSDTEIAHAAVSALQWDTEVPHERITTRVENGWLTLEGNVDWYYQKESAARAVRFLTGVKGVTNRISVRQATASPREVSEKIKAALRRGAEHEAERINVEVREGKVTLRGTVHSWAERQQAQHAAWSAPGVTAVDDQIMISP